MFSLNKFLKVGLDEAYVDITEIVKERLVKKSCEETALNDFNKDFSCVSSCEKTEMAETVVKEIRENIKATTLLTASAGW